MRQKGRADITQQLLIGLVTFMALGTAHAQIAAVDFQVIHLSGIRGSKLNYLAVRTQDEWIRLWQSGSLEATLPASMTGAAPSK
jgi:hypothetical protein